MEKKQQVTIERLDQLFRDILERKDSTQLKKFLQFTERMPMHAPFNNGLVFAQNPNCTYYATAKQWRDRFRREVRYGARPAVILVPFGPVEFVYDVEDTEGDHVADRDFLYWWEEAGGGKMSVDILEHTIESCKRIELTVVKHDDHSYFHHHSMQTMGYASIDALRKREIHLHPRYEDVQYQVEAYGVLCHEIAHHLLGHLGEVEYKVTKKGDSTMKSVCHDRTNIPRHIAELEAELVAWMVFSMFGMKKESATYMATWLTNQQDLKVLSISEVLKVAGKIRDMGTGVVRW